MPEIDLKGLLIALIIIGIIIGTILYAIISWLIPHIHMAISFS